MSERHRLSDRRASDTFTIDCAGLVFDVSASYFNDGRLGELFLSSNKAGSQAETMAKDCAIVCSIALQYGADLETIRRALCRDSQGRPSSPLGVALDALAETERA